MEFNISLNLWEIAAILKGSGEEFESLQGDLFKYCKLYCDINGWTHSLKTGVSSSDVPIPDIICEYILHNNHKGNFK